MDFYPPPSLLLDRQVDRVLPSLFRNQKNLKKMKKTIILLLAAGSLLAYSCKKDKKDVSHRSDPPKVTHVAHRDDHRPIIIVRVVDENGSIIQNAYVIVTNSNVVFSGNTDADGIFNADINAFAQWSIQVSATDYYQSSFSVTTIDSVTNVTDTLVASGN